jgi:hypothetical protein
MVGENSKEKQPEYCFLRANALPMERVGKNCI